MNTHFITNRIRHFEEVYSQPIDLNYPFVVFFIYIGTVMILTKFLSVHNLYVNLIFPQLFFFVATLGLLRMKRMTLSQIGFQTSHAGIITSAICVITLIGIIAVLVILTPNEKLLFSSLTSQKILTLVMSVLIAPIVEEAFCRGILLPSLTKPFGAYRAILISALLFMAAHLKIHFGAFLLGIVAGSLFAITQSLLPAIAFHATCNMIGFYVYWFSPDLFRFIKFLYA